MSSTPVKVLLVDDHPFVRDGLQQLLEHSREFEVVGHAGDGHEAQRIAKSIVPDMIIMDVLMPGQDGIEACREIIDALPNTHVLMLTASTEKNAVLEAVAAGAAGYVQKFTPTEQLLTAVRDVARGEYRMPRDAMRRVFARLRNAPKPDIPPKAKQAHAEGEGGTRTIRQGHVVYRHCRVPGQPPYDGAQHHLRHTGQAGVRQQAGGCCVGRSERSVGRRGGRC